ncbi:2'-5' RNA ligase family protein [Nisaea sediminum]|uniref:2'-5' RNA ligase family protein n=1 Tax=Nisaea sediminum TaxID=2775867 RepID=UPI001865B4E8|nr:2'-5' RNA ligase family protein [Nisaea sediminum]
MNKMHCMGSVTVGEQLSLAFGSPAPAAISFFALRPDARAAREMTEVGKLCRARCGSSARLYGPDRLHLSLVPAVSRSGFRRCDVEAACGAAARIRINPFTLRFDRLCTFGGRDKRPVVLRCDDDASAVTALRSLLRKELAKAGLCPGITQFQPHVTLFWDRNRVPETRLEAPIGWEVEEFVLVRSLIGRSRQVELARWTLRGG